MDKKQVAIIGAGISGLAACKYCLSKGFEPVVFESESDIGGVWAKTIKTTRLQQPKIMYQFSDFPWPSTVTDVFPTQQQIHDYLRSYAKHFDLAPYINLHSKVKGISYDGPWSEKWSLWNGTGRFKDVPNIPEFPKGKGPEVFQGQAIHSMKYAAMDNDKAAAYVKGKKVVIIGFGKTGLDIARECASVNGPEIPCTVVYRRDHWKLPDWHPWRFSLAYLYFNRFSELLVHKPGEGLLLSLIATLLSPLRWGVSKFVESHINMKYPFAKFDMVPKQSFSKDTYSCMLSYLPNPDTFFDALEKGSIKMKKSPSYSFYEKGILIEEDKTKIEADIVIFAIGFKGVEKLSNIFKQSTFGHFITGSPRVPLYRECIHPRIPQLAIIGFSESLSNIHTSDMRAKWVTTLLEGAFKLPSVNEMQKDIERWDEYMKQSSGEYHHRSSIGALEIWYYDQLCKDIGMDPRRKNGLWADLFEPYGPIDYATDSS